MNYENLTLDNAAEDLQKSFNELSKIDLKSLSADERAAIKKELNKIMELILQLKEDNKPKNVK